MDWIQTYTGRRFFPLEPNPADVDIRDIAHALALETRFGGHSRVFYSVAEHCVRVSHEVEPPHALWGLLHDAAEAYLADVPRPVKANWPEFERTEQRVLTAVQEHFHFSPGCAPGCVACGRCPAGDRSTRPDGGSRRRLGAGRITTGAAYRPNDVGGDRGRILGSLPRTDGRRRPTIRGTGADELSC